MPALLRWPPPPLYALCAHEEGQREREPHAAVAATSRGLLLRSGLRREDEEGGCCSRAQALKATYAALHHPKPRVREHEGKGDQRGPSTAVVALCRVKHHPYRRRRRLCLSAMANGSVSPDPPLLSLDGLSLRRLAAVRW